MSADPSETTGWEEDVVELGEDVTQGVSMRQRRLSSKMEARKWEELAMDCLVNVLGRVGVESRLLDVPFVCKSWYKATLSPLCWRRLDFPEIQLHPRSSYSSSRLIDRYHIKDDSSVTAFIKSVVKRSKGSATLLVLPPCCTEEALLFVADECPNLRVLALPQNYSLELKIPSLMSKWKSLEFLRLGSCFEMERILAQVRIHCKNLVGLGLNGGSVTGITIIQASAIVNDVPNIKYLSLRHAYIRYVENLERILRGCTKLVYLDARHVEGFYSRSKKISKLASHITTFKPEGSLPIHRDYEHCDLDDSCPWGADSFFDLCSSY